MIVRIQFVKTLNDGSRRVIYKWAIYSVNASTSFLDIFKDIKSGVLTCGLDVDLSWTEEQSV